MKKLIKLFTYLLFAIFFVLVLFTENKLSILLVMIPFAVLYKFVDKIQDKYFIIILFFLALFIRVITSVYLKVPIMDDFKIMYDASKSFVAGDLSFTKNIYFTNFSYQLGFVFIQGMFLKIVNNLLFLKIVNSIITSLIVVFIFLTSRNISSSRSSKVISLLYTIYFYPIYLNSVLTNQHIQALLILIIIYLITRKDNNKIIDNSIIKSILIGLLLSISNIARSEAIVFIFSFIVIGIIHLHKKSYKKVIKPFAITMTIFLIVTLGVNFLLKLNHITENGLKNNAPLWKFYVGLNVDHNGMYNEADQSLFFSKNNKDQKTLLIKRIKDNYLKFPVLFVKKEVVTFTKSNFNIIIDNKINNSILKFVLNFSNGILFLILLLFLIGIFPRKKQIDNRVVSILIILFVYFGVYLLIEVSPRYGYNLQMIIFILSSLGIDKMINWNQKRNKVSKNEYFLSKSSIHKLNKKL